jgi:hypothetical protein
MISVCNLIPDIHRHATQVTEPIRVDIGPEWMVAGVECELDKTSNRPESIPIPEMITRSTVVRVNLNVGVEGEARILGVRLSIRDGELDNRGSANRRHIRGHNEARELVCLHLVNRDR